MATTIGTIGEEVELLVRQGATCGPFPVLIKDSTGTPVDMTGSTLRGQVRKDPFDTTVLLSFGFVLVNTSLVSFTFELTKTQTAGLSCGDTADHPGSRYHYDIEWEDAAGTVRPLFYGQLKVHREVTRA